MAPSLDSSWEIAISLPPGRQRGSSGGDSSTLVEVDALGGAHSCPVGITADTMDSSEGAQKAWWGKGW